MRKLATTVLLGTAVLVGLLGQDAHADEARALAIYADAKAKYQAGDYAEAIELFDKAYAEHPKAAYLFNAAQAYRQLDDCPNALRYYRRFAKAKPDAAAAAQPHIDSLQADCGDQVTDDDNVTDGENLADDAGVMDPSQDDVNNNGADDSKGIDRDIVTPAGPRGPIVVFTAEVGASFFNVGDVITPVAATLRLGAAHPLVVGPVTLELGAIVELAPMAYDDVSGDSTATWTTVLANVAAVYPLGQIKVGGELGLGLLRLSSLNEGNPFTDQMAAAGSSSSFSVRIGGFGEYDLIPGLTATVSPAFVYAGAADAFRDAISSVTRIELLGGARYRW